MLTKAQKDNFRGDIFRHLDGIATATTAFALYEKGVLQHLLDKQAIGTDELCKQFEANEGYLNVGLRLLCSQGWLDYNEQQPNESIGYRINERSQRAFALVPKYDRFVKILPHAIHFTDAPIEPGVIDKLQACFESYSSGLGLDLSDELAFQVFKHIEGVIAAPLIVMLGVNGFFHKYFMEASFKAHEYHKDPERFAKILDFFTQLDWFTKKNETYKFTDKGLFFAKRASAYGVTVSYLPTFVQLDELIFGDPLILKTESIDQPEKHVNREMNVWGSGGAHSNYFKVVDEIVIELFNRPIDQQPKGVLDMGCGNGAFIEHIFDVIEQRTIRGTQLDEYPLFLVGADFNQAALKVTRANLITADIWAKVIWGDIGKPDDLANTLKEDYDINLNDLLNVRTFLDHNRIWEPPEHLTNRIPKSTGAFAFKGNRINNSLVEDSLKEHLERWKPYVEQFGLLVIELHTLDPALAASNLGKTAVTAYDGTHGYSDQYIVEAEIFKSVAMEAGLESDERYESRYPRSELATVSIHLFKGTKSNHNDI